jgi:uncharacterized membrane protein YgcG
MLFGLTKNCFIFIKSTNRGTKFANTLLKYKQKLERIIIMKSKDTIKQILVSIIALTTFAIVICSCGVGFSTYGYDDVYASRSERVNRQVNVTPRQQVAIYQDTAYSKSTEIYTDTLLAEDTVTEQTTEYGEYNEDDYYDYAYTARIRRFHRPYLTYDYYSDYYTNLYWYNSDPWYWGTSIYLGYHWWYPSYWGYYSWYSPYWYYGYPYYGYHHHHNGNNGHGHHNIAYYNSHDRNSNFYTRERGSTSTFGNKYNMRSASVIATTRPNSSIERRPSATTNNRIQKPPQHRSQNITASRDHNNNQTINRNTQNTNRRYTPPSVRQPRSTSEFTRKPAIGNNNNFSRPRTSEPSRNVSTPQRNNSRSNYSTPSQSNNSGSSFRSSSSSRSSGSYSGGSNSSSSRSGGRR